MSMRRTPFLGLAIVGALLAGAAPAAAQLAFGFGQAGTPAAVIDAAPVRAPQPARTRLRLLPLERGGRLSGEWDSIRVPLYVTAAQSSGPLSVQISYVAAAAVRPELSMLTVTLNGKPIGQVSIEAFEAPRNVAMSIPIGLARIGDNELRIEVRQSHRVDCSVDATHELWTQIQPALTGLLVPEVTARLTQVDDLAALQVDPDGVLPIRAFAPSRVSPATIDRLLLTTQSIAKRHGSLQPRVEFGTLEDGDAGVDVVLGPFEDIRNLPELATLGPVQGPLLRLHAPAERRRPVLVITGRTEDETNEALARFLASAKDKAMPDLSGGATISFKDLGVDVREFDGRLLRQRFSIVLPNDLYAANYATPRLLLDGAYAAGLTGAQLNISANGRLAMNLSLPRTDGEAFRAKELKIPLGLLRPGRNDIELEAILPHRDDASCAPDVLLKPHKRLLIVSSSRLEMPQIARVGALPDLAATLGAGFRYADAKPMLYLPQPNRQLLASAATLAARMAVSSGRIIPFQFVTSMRDSENADVIEFSLNPLVAPAPAEKKPDASDDLLQSWQDDLARQNSLQAKAARLVAGVASGVSKMAAGTGLMSTPAPRSGDSSVVVTQRLSGPDQNRVWTTFSSDTPAHMTQGMAQLTKPDAWSKIGGAGLVMSQTGELGITTSEREHFVQTAPLSPGNIRLIAAGWLSRHHLAYLAIALLIAVCLAGSTVCLTRHVGRRSE